MFIQDCKADKVPNNNQSKQSWGWGWVVPNVDRPVICQEEYEPNDEYSSRQAEYSPWQVPAMVWSAIWVYGCPASAWSISLLGRPSAGVAIQQGSDAPVERVDTPASRLGPIAGESIGHLKLNRN